MQNRQYKFVLLRLNLILAIVEGLIVLWSLLSVTSEAESAFLFGYSLPRLLLLASILIALSVLAWLLWETFRRSDSSSIIKIPFDRAGTFWLLLAVGVAAYFLIFASDRTLGDFLSYRTRLSPIIVWIGLICLQSILVFMLLRSAGSGLVRSHRDVLLPSGIFLLLLAGLTGFVSLTRIGLNPDAIYWQGPGVPLLFSQVIIAVVIGLAVHSVANWISRRNSGWVSTAIYFVIGVAAIVLWWSQPARISYNVLEPTPPNFQRYPFGDAILYDTVAHDMLNGTAIPNDFWVKPLYSAFLAFLHLFSQENYSLVILLQIVVLASIPVLVYAIVNILGNRPAGLIAALLVILRERNAIALANVIQVSHLKLLLSDVFTMGLVVLIVWLMYRWFEEPEERRGMPLLMGGGLGLLVLTRGHPIVLLPFIFLVIFIHRASSSGQQWQRVGLLVSGFALVLVPWLWRIFETTGRVALQSPVSPYSVNLAGLYRLTPNLADPEAFTTAVSSQTLEQSDQQNSQILDFVIQYPGEVLRFVSAHYSHNVIYSYIFLPQSFRIESLRAYVTTEPFWRSWMGDLSVQNRILLIINITLLALGIGAAWRKHTFLGLAPMLIGMGYNASVSVGRISGWRFIQPVDWITLVYYSLGIVQLFHLVGFLLARGSQENQPAEESQQSLWRIPHYVWITAGGILFFLIGTAVPYGHKLFAGRFPPVPAKQLVDDYITATTSTSQLYSAAHITEFLRADRARILYGQAIYPYFIEAEHGPINHAWPAYKPRPYGRLVFYLSGPVSTNVILPLQSSDFTFPDGANVIVLGCINDLGDVEASSVLIEGDTSEVFQRQPVAPLSCPRSLSP